MDEDKNIIKYNRKKERGKGENREIKRKKENFSSREISKRTWRET